MLRSRTGSGEWNPEHFAHDLKFAILRPAPMQGKNQQALLGFCLIKRLFQSDAASAGFERVFEWPRMTANLLTRNLMPRVTDVPDPQIRLRQGLVQGLGGGHRHQALCIRAAEKNGNPHHSFRSFVIPGCAEGTDPESLLSISLRDSGFALRAPRNDNYAGIPIRLISQCNSIPQCAFTLARTVSPSASISWPVAAPVLMRKLQCISDTGAPPTRKPRQPAASISFHALCPGGFLKVEPPVFSRIGWGGLRVVFTPSLRARRRAGE